MFGKKAAGLSTQETAEMARPVVPSAAKGAEATVTAESLQPVSGALDAAEAGDAGSAVRTFSIASNIFRKSVNRPPAANCSKALPARRSSRSQTATMFWLETPRRFDPPWPPTPITATLSLSFGPSARAAARPCPAK